MALRALVLQHIACEPPGTYEDVLDERGAEIDRIEIDEGDTLPDWRAYDAIVAMGGPMGADDERHCHRSRTTPHRTGCRGREAVLGRLSRRPAPCGNLGAPVYRGPAGGRHPPRHAHRGRAVRRRLRPAPEQLPTLQWHGDTFDLPPGAIRLAGSPAYPNQAFKVRNAYGVQFHLEVSPGLAREWAEVPEYAASLERMLGPGALDG